MNKVVAGVAVLAVVAGGSVGVAAWSGPKVATELQEHTAKWLQLFPGVKVLDQHVTTGLLSSTHEVTVQLGCEPPAAAASGASAGDAAAEPVKITWRDHIQHGPFPGARSVGLAAIDSELVLPPKAAAELAKLLGNQPAFRARTVLGFGGGYVSDISSPAFKYAEDGKGDVEWKGLNLVVRGSLKGGLAAGATYAMDAPGLLFTLKQAEGPATTVKVGAFNMKGELLPNPEPSLWMSPHKGTATLSGVEFSTRRPGADAAAKPLDIVFDGFQFSGESTLDKGLMSSVSKFSVKGRIDDFNVDKLEMQQSLHRVHAATYQQMMSRVFGQALSCDKPADPLAIQMAAMEEMQKTMVALLRYDPEYALDKLSIDLGGQHAELSYSVGARGVTEADGALPASQLMMTKGYANAAVKVQMGWIEQIAKKVAGMNAAGGPAGADPATAQQAAQTQIMAMANMLIDDFAGKGFVVRDGDSVKAAAKFEAGQLQVNDKPMPLPPMMGAQ